MKYSDIKKAVKLVISSLDVPIIVGESGIGKTALVREVAKDMNATLVTIDANLLKEGEIGGLPTVSNGETIYATYSKLAIVNREIKKGKDVLIFIDELNRCDHAVQQELMNIILNREINGYEIGDKARIVAAVNPFSEDGYGAGYDVVEMDLAQKDRFVWLDMEADVKEWIKWGMKDDKIESEIIQFISTFPEYLNSKTVEGDIKPSPRSFERVSNAFKVYKANKAEYSDEIFMNIVKGNIGNEIALDFMTFIKDNKKPMITPSDVFAYEVLSGEIIDRIKEETNSRLYILVKQLVSYLEEKTERANEIKIFGKLLGFYPRDLRLGVMKEIKRDSKNGVYEELLDSDEFLEAFYSIYDN